MLQLINDTIPSFHPEIALSLVVHNRPMHIIYGTKA